MLYTNANYTFFTGMLFILAGALHAHAQGSHDDYQRADALRSRTNDKVQQRRVEPHWIGKSGSFWYRVSTGTDQHRYILVDANSGERKEAFDHQHLAAALSEATKQEVSADRLGLGDMVMEIESNIASFSKGNKYWSYDVASQVLNEVDRESPSRRELPVLRGPRRSKRTGEETVIRFTNRTDQSLQLFWINNRSERIAYGSIAAKDKRDQHTFAGHVWSVANESGETVATFEAIAELGQAVVESLNPLRRPEGRSRRSERPQSPDGLWEAYVRDHNVFIRQRESGEEFALTTEGSEQDSYVPRFSWSPDSKKLVVVQETPGENREVQLIESSPTDRLQPRLHTFAYAKPGDRMPAPRPKLFDITDRRQVPISEELHSTPWSISDIRWQRDSNGFTFLYNERGHQVLRVIKVDADTGEVAALIDEQSDTFIDYAHKQYSNYLDDTNEIIWMSERDGWNHLYLVDAKTGQIKNQMTTGPWVVRGVERVDQQARQVWFRAGGVYPEQDPYYVHHCRVNLDGTDFVILTAGNGTHEVEFSPEGEWLIDTYSRVDLPPVTELRRTSDGAFVCELENANWSPLLETGWLPPERFFADGRDGTTKIYGVIFRPTNFDVSGEYPIIEKIYAGPQGAHVPKKFASFHSAQALAELGFIVVQIDGMGTSYRSKAFHDVCCKNLADAGFPDRISWIIAAAAKYPQMDLSRVGIYGGSAGGQNALGGLLWHGDFYKVGAADCGCHDNRMDKIWWNELWMGYPIGPHYKEQSNVTQAHRLEGKVLLTVGELDRNVDPASTMQVVDALIKADKDFDLLIVPGAGHGAGGSTYCTRRRNDFFVRHLLDVEPRWKLAKGNQDNEDK